MMADPEGEAGPVGGEEIDNGWVSSAWLGWHYPMDGNWIFHQYHGRIYVGTSSADDEFISLWDPMIGDWLLTTEEDYKDGMVFFWGQQKWFHFTRVGSTRVFTYIDPVTSEETVLDYVGFDVVDPTSDMTP